MGGNSRGLSLERTIGSSGMLRAGVGWVGGDQSSPGKSPTVGYSAQLVVSPEMLYI